ncbi:MAG: VWA domain-containing protein [Chloroflexaceae bacterium]|nr:VWA domain-containing protein [Chloroflexaceae bacterium]
MQQAMTLTCTWGRTPMPVSNTPQVNYLLVEAQPDAPPSTPVPLNFCLVLDHSGSMKGEKLANMKAATRRVIETLTPQDIVSLVIFDDTVQTVLPATAATDKAALIAQIDQIDAVGGTAMSLGLQTGQQELQKHLSPDRVNHLLLLTDGQTWGDEDACRDVARSLSREDVPVTALGLGDEWNEQLLDDLANLTDGSSDYVADPSQIDAFFQRAVTTAQGTAARDARLLMRLITDVTPRAVYRVTPTIANLGYEPIVQNEVLLKLGDITYGNSGCIALDLMLPARTEGSFRIANAELHYLPLGEQTPQILKQDIVLDFSANPDAPRYTARVMNIVEKVTAFKLQTRALEEAQAGNLSSATQKLRAAATRLLDMGEVELATRTQQQAEELEQGGGMTAETQKALRYATRRLTQKLEP